MNVQYAGLLRAINEQKRVRKENTYEKNSINSILSLLLFISCTLTNSSFASSTADGTPPEPHAYAITCYPNIFSYHGVGGYFKIPSIMSAKWYKNTNSQGQILSDSDLFNFINFEQWIPIYSGGGIEWLEGGYHDGFWLPNGVGTFYDVTSYTGLFAAKMTSSGYQCWKVSGNCTPGNTYHLAIKESFTRINSSEVIWHNTWYMYLDNTIVTSFGGSYKATNVRDVKQGFEICIESDTKSKPVVTASNISYPFVLTGRGVVAPWYYADAVDLNDNGQTGRFGITASKTLYNDGTTNTAWCSFTGTSN